MTSIARTPRVDAIAVSGKKLPDAIAAAVTTIRVDHQEATIGEIVVDFATGAALTTNLATEGAPVTFDGEPLSVANVAAAFGATIEPSITLRSRVARRLLQTSGASVEKGTSPSQWVARRVRRAGGTAICQPSATRKHVAQKGGKEAETDLDVLQRLADDLGYSWIEQDGVVVFAARTWVVQTKPRGSRTLTRDTATFIAATFENTPDSDTDLATGTITVAQELGVKVKLWQVLTLKGFSIYSGDWLVTGVSGERDTTSDWSITVARPKKRPVHTKSS